MSVSAIIVGAGTGHRIGRDTPKQYLSVAGKPVFYYTLKRFEECALVDAIVVVVARDWMVHVGTEIVDKFGFEKVRKVVDGGSERQDSVWAGLQAMESSPWVAIHDAVRPFISARKLEEVIRAGQKFGAAILAVSPRDTIKTERDGFVDTTPARNQLRAVQTPQVFDYEILMSAYQKAIHDNVVSTDDSALVERMGHRVKIVEGESNNIKITVPLDLRLAEMLIQEEG